MRQTPDLDGRLVPELKVYTRQAETDDGERRGAHELVGRHLSDHLFFFSSRRRHTRCLSDWSSDVCSSDLETTAQSASTPTTGRCQTFCGIEIQRCSSNASGLLTKTFDCQCPGPPVCRSPLPSNDIMR